MRTTALHPDFGVEIDGIDLRNVTAQSAYREIRAAFEEHSLLLHRGRPWPNDQPRTLVSICVTARDSDGLASVRPGRGRAEARVTNRARSVSGLNSSRSH